MTPTRLCLALLLLTVAHPATAQTTPDTPFTGADIEAAGFIPGGLPSGRTALTAKVQMLLDRAGISPGVTDGYRGGMSDSAIRAFERQNGLPIDGVLDIQVWGLLQQNAAEPVTQIYTISEADAEGLVEAIPADYAEKAQMANLGYTSLAEKLGERFHMDDRFIAFLNPGVALVPGAQITVMRPAKPIKGEVARIIIDRAVGRVAAYDAADRLIADYPATVGSSATPSPSGNHVVEAVALNPNYTYNPSKNFQQGDNDKVLTIPPGPNGPVGTVWIDLSKPTYGIHGTPTPSRLFVNQSYGCVRLTNWDAWELAHMVRANVTKVEFLPEGTGITDVIAPVAAQPATNATAQGPVAAAQTDGTALTYAGTTGVSRPLPRPASVSLAALDAGALANAIVETIGSSPAAAGDGTAVQAPSGQAVAPNVGTGTGLPDTDPAMSTDPLAQALSAASQGAAAVQAVPQTDPEAEPGAASDAPFALPQNGAERPGAVTITPAAPDA